MNKSKLNALLKQRSEKDEINFVHNPSFLMQCQLHAITGIETENSQFHFVTKVNFQLIFTFPMWGKKSREQFLR